MPSARPTIILFSGAWHTAYHISPCIDAFHLLHYGFIGRPLLAAGKKATTEETIADIVHTIEQELEHSHVYVILHSAAGLLGTEALNRLRRENLHRLLEVFYLASILDWTALIDRITQINSFAPLPNEDATVALEGASMFFNDAEQSIAEDFERHLVPQWNNDPKLSSQQYKEVTKTYVHCLEDKVITLELSQKTAKDYGMRFETFIGAHSGFSTRPVDFANFIDKLIRSSR